METKTTRKWIRKGNEMSILIRKSRIHSDDKRKSTEKTVRVRERERGREDILEL